MQPAPPPTHDPPPPLPPPLCVVCVPLRCDMVIEAVIEDIPLKQRIFSDLEASCRPDCILSTNTSTIDINLVGAKTSE